MFVLGSIALVTAVAACGSNSSSSTTPTSNRPSAPAMAGPTGGPGLVGATWSLEAAAINSVDLSGHGITIEFTDTAAGGNSGVNTYSTTFTSSSKGDLAFGDIASTEMAGDEAAMSAEQAYLALLKTVTGYSVNGAELDLFVDRQEVLTYATQ
jgi:heat shock protein HslJ